MEILNTIDNEEQDLQKIHFKKLSFDYFQLTGNPSRISEEAVKENSKFYSISLPAQIGENFIQLQEAPLLWVYRSPLNSYLEDFVKLYFSSGYDLSFIKIREFYNKWLMIKSENEKKYFASSAIQNIEKNLNKKNFLVYILHANILAYEKSFYNPEKALELLDKAKEIANFINLKQVFSQEIKYFLHLYSGFILLKLNDYQQADLRFNEALSVKPGGANAGFYLAVCEAALGQNDSAKFLLKEILNNDIARLGFAIEKNHLPLLIYFIKNSASENIFRYGEFLPLADFIEEEFIKLNNENINPSELSQKFSEFIDIKEPQLDEYLTEKIAPGISFLKKFFQNSELHSNIFYKPALEKIKEKFSFILESIIASAKQKHYSGIKESLKDFERSVSDLNENINKYAKQLEEEKKNLGDKLTAALKKIEKAASGKIEVLENKINNLHLDKKLSSQAAFSNTMTYNLILSLLVFLVAGYSESFKSNELQLSSIISIVFLGGIKWGIIAFLIGFLFALLAAGSAVIEKANKRQRLLQIISEVKNSREAEVNAYKKEAGQKEKIISETISAEIEELKQKISQITKEKEEKENLLKSEADKEIEKVSSKLKVLLVS